MMVNIEAKDFPIEGLEANGQDVKVHVPREAERRSYNLFGDQDGSIIVDGDGAGIAHRAGAGNGDAHRDGEGLGNAYRWGAGNGSAYRYGAGGGDAYRDGEVEEDE
jgi:hypothetical protein